MPPNVSDYRVSELIADLHGLLDALDLESATFVGHDWGAMLLWQMAMLAPARIDSLVIDMEESAQRMIDALHAMKS